MESETDLKREVKPAIWSGLKLRCPCCGRGKLFSKYLKVVDACADCGEEMKHHRADDGPAYLTIVIVGHIAGLLMMLLWEHSALGPGAMATLLSVISIILSLALLPSMKGLMVAVQWANRMHGFGRKNNE